MALSLILNEAGVEPRYADAAAHVTIRPHEGGFKIAKIHLVCDAGIPGIDAPTFERHAEKAKANCPVSKALAGTGITLGARLRSQ